MRRTLLMGVMLAVTLAGAGPAHAKGNITAVTMCGPAGCGPPTAPGPMRTLAERVFGGGGMARGAPPFASYDRVRFGPVGEVPDISVFYVPSSATLCVGQVCGGATGRLRTVLDTAAAGVSGYVPRIRSLTVGDVKVDPRPYAGLFDRLTSVTPPAGLWNATGIAIVAHLTPDSPWSASGVSTMTYYARYRVLARNGEWLRVDAALDHRIRADAGALPGGGGSGRIATALAIALLSATGALALGFGISRVASRRPRPAGRRSLWAKGGMR
jgi:hypothetical protein